MPADPLERAPSKGSTILLEQATPENYSVRCKPGCCCWSSEKTARAKKDSLVLGVQFRGVLSRFLGKRSARRKRSGAQPGAISLKVTSSPCVRCEKKGFTSPKGGAINQSADRINLDRDGFFALGLHQQQVHSLAP